MSGRVFEALFAVALACCTAGCSFHPLYARAGPGAGGQQVFNSIYVEPVDGERAGYELRNSLIDLLEGAERPQLALYRLKVTVKQTIEGTAVQTNGSITRYSYTMVANYELSDIHSGKDVTKGTESTVSGYDVVASPYATLVAQQDAQKLGARDIADRIRIDLGVYFSKRSSS
ncbi:MAG TPA: LPS assembly lipoprotein LptE [Rhizomicrobium sp.]|jgi:LPS-assembly lipoprotein|nr:LPS assembly lipoprotein LptE [Rhizomicrobium sp.]